MRLRRAVPALAAAAMLLAAAAGPRAAAADVIHVTPGAGALQAALEAAPPGAVVRLAAGVYPGPVVIERTLTLEGEPGAILDGGGTGPRAQRRRARRDSARAHGAQLRAPASPRPTPASSSTSRPRAR